MFAEIMFLQQLQLINYRNLSAADFYPGEHLNVLWGDNGQGKTNILEAIFFLGFLKSFRGVRNDELTTRGESSTSISARVEKNSVSHQLAVSWSQQTRATRIDGKNVSGASAFIGMVPAILFSPEEIGLIRAYPVGRRNLLDRAIFLTQSSFLESVREYQRQLRHRNQLLKEQRPEREIKPWTEGLINNGARLRRARISFLQRLSPWLTRAYSEICQQKEQVSLQYPGAETADQEQLLAAEFSQVASRERRFGQTLAGPHRDDPLFLLDGAALKTYGSQGQQRSFILAFKCAQVLDYEEVKGDHPLLLLDDLTSELDPGRREAFIEFIQKRQGQAFLTTTDRFPLREKFAPSTRFFNVRIGMVIEQ